MAKNYDRNQQIAEEITHSISKFLHDHLSEQYSIITCTRVDLAKDQHTATVYISFYPALENTNINSVIAPIRHDLIDYVRKRVPMKFIPIFTFKLDTSGGYAEKIDKLIDKL